MTTLNENLTDSTEEFAERMVGAIDSASLAILLWIGHQTKLFDTLAELPPATSAQIADAVGLNERYVREWLGGGGGLPRCRLRPCLADVFAPPSIARRCVTRAAGPDELARVAQFIPMLGEVEQKIIGCFHGGGGLSYSEVSAVPQGDGRGERRGVRRRARRCHPADGRRSARPTSRRR